MIELVGKPGDGTGKIRFTPRTGFKRTQPTLEKELIYGYFCQKCSNVVLALFVTDSPVNLWHYEETTTISLGEKTYGEVNRILPNETSTEGFSCYGQLTFEQGKQKGQRIRLKKHLLTTLPIVNPWNAEKIFETGGEHCCEYTGWFSRREDLLMKDVLLANNVVATDVATYTPEQLKVSSFIGSPLNSAFRALPGIGNVPPLILTSRVSFATKNRQFYECRNIMAQVQKGQDVSI